MNWKNIGRRAVLPLCIIALLVVTYWYGGDAPNAQGWTVSQTTTVEVEPSNQIAPEVTLEPELEPEVVESEIEFQMETETESAPESEIEPAPAPEPVEVPEPEPQAGDALTCTLTVRCDTILDHMDWLAEGKGELVPEDGILLPQTQVTFYHGETVFQLLQREMKVNGIHMEFSYTPVYNSAYIEGIGNLYEFDCGQQSGWVYQVDGWAPNYGPSQYLLTDGADVAFLYTCDLGVDVGGGVIGGGDGA